MGEKAVSDPEEIMSLARDLPRLAAQRRAAVELGWDQPEISSDPASKAAFDNLRAGYAWIVEAFGRAVALAPDPRQFDPLIDVMKAGDGCLTNHIELGLAGVDSNGNVVAAAKQPKDPFWAQISGMQAKVGEWTGDAADNFRDNFLSHLEVVPPNQSLAFRGLNVAARTTQKVYEQFLLDLGELVTKARAALHPGRHFCSAGSLEVALGLAAGISKLAVGVVTLEEGTGLFVAAEGGVEIVNAIFESGKEEGGEGYSVDEPDVEGILDATNDILNHIVTLLGQHEQDIINIIRHNKDAVQLNRNSFLVPAPTVVDLSNKAWADRSVDGQPVKDLWNNFD
jgi:hypothetical protein